MPVLGMFWARRLDVFDFDGFVPNQDRHAHGAAHFERAEAPSTCAEDLAQACRTAVARVVRSGDE